MFAQPLAWIGLIGLAVPIAIHLLAQLQAVRTLFPSLRFIDPTDVTFIKRQRITDVPLLIVRLATIAASVAALAGPRAAERNSAGTGPLSRAVVVDVSPSAGGARADSAGAAAARAAVTDASASTIVEARSLRAGIESASAWLNTQPGRRELIVVSDFQRGSIADRDVAAVPAGIGVHFIELPMTPRPLPRGLELTDERSRMTWAAAHGRPRLPVEVKAGPDQSRADAMLAAVAAVAAAPDGGSDHHARVVFSGAIERAGLLASALPINQPWMFDAMRPLLDDPALRSHVIARASGETLAVMLDLDPASEQAAVAISLLLQQLQQPTPLSELEPRAVPPEMFRQWERAPAPAPAPNTNEPQGHGLWLIVLMLLGLETWMRRRRRVVAVAVKEQPHAHVA